MTKKSFIKKLDSAAKKYDEFLERTRETGKGIKKDYTKIKKIIVPRAKETYQTAYTALKPTRDYVSTTRTNIQREFAVKPKLNPKFDNAPFPKPFKREDVWSGRSTQGLRGRRFPKLF